MNERELALETMKSDNPAPLEWLFVVYSKGNWTTGVSLMKQTRPRQRYKMNSDSRDYSPVLGQNRVKCLETRQSMRGFAALARLLLGRFLHPPWALLSSLVSYRKPFAGKGRTKGSPAIVDSVVAIFLN